MKLTYFRTLLILCTTIVLLCKVTNMVSYLSYSSTDSAYQLSNDDATEKEEKKIESEYFIDQFFVKVHLNVFSPTEKKVIIPDHSFKLTYFPEVLTPPPSA